jgi:hypothetical protein
MSSERVGMSALDPIQRKGVHVLKYSLIAFT